MPVPASELWERRGDIFAAALRPQAVRETTTATTAAEALPQVGEALWRSRGALMERLLREHLTR